MKKLLILTLSLFTLTTALGAEKRINTEWLFSLGDNSAASKVNFDDSSWQEINLPHDWAFELGYDQYADQKEKGGYAYGGIGWYRKTIKLSAEELENSTQFIDFEAVYMNSEVWVNGEYLGKRPYGYISFSYDITPYLHAGENIVAVRVDNSLEPSARWYHGCGIYGSVWLRSEGESYFEKDATFITTATVEEKLTGEVNLSTVVKHSGESEQYTIEWTIKNMEGKRVAKSRSKTTLSEGSNALTATLKVKNFEFWDTHTPNLYTLEGVIKNRKGKEVSSVSDRFGFRTVKWDGYKGFFLNGKQVKIDGVCEHLEGGPTGAIWTESLIRWKLQLIKDMGCNAVRVAHNPQLPLFYDICDEMGLMVMDEIFDGWKKKADFDYGMQSFDEWWERDVRAWIRRDRNHPSIIIYSVGNETGGDVGSSLVRVCHEEDPTRLVTSGHSASEVMDVLGINGHSESFEFLNNYEPNEIAFVGTENPHTWQVRGFYRTKTWYRDGYTGKNKSIQYIEDLTPEEIFAYDWTSPQKRMSPKQVFNSSYDNATVRVTARHILEYAKNHDWFTGYFRWTGFDYFGEAGYVHGGWPFRIFQSGALDVAGFPKDLYYLYQSEWSNVDMVHILPHWTHPTMAEGTEIPVWVYTNGDEVELFFNGESLGKQSKGSKWNEIQCSWMVPYRSGELEAVAYRNGVEIARESVATAGAPAELAIQVENDEMKADFMDVSIITLTQVDSKGEFYPYGENRQYAYVEGDDARILSIESGSPIDSEKNFGVSSRCAFFGLNRVFVQSTSEELSPVSVLVASINGDKKLMLGDKVSITAEWVSLRGECSEAAVKVYYTTDGSAPTVGSTLYSAPFSVTLGTTVRAIACRGSEVLIEMEERFAEDEGIYWGVAGESVCDLSGDQAELGVITGGSVEKWNGDGFFGESYVILKSGGTLSWYQENDGSPMTRELLVRYSIGQEGMTGSLKLYNNEQYICDVPVSYTGSVAAHWREASVKVPIATGANNLRLSNGFSGDISIDQTIFND
ncbi:MAG: glycoside hydrolase family 2 TIM barrel-domain containing protein [Rikenellaceae bacterium]